MRRDLRFLSSSGMAPVSSSGRVWLVGVLIIVLVCLCFAAFARNFGTLSFLVMIRGRGWGYWGLGVELA